MIVAVAVPRAAHWWQQHVESVIGVATVASSPVHAVEPLAMNYLAVAIAGAVGTIARLALSRWIAPLCVSFPLHTFAINVVGCLLFGACWGFGAVRWSSVVTTSVLAGFFGAFTTFSSFAFETVALVDRQQFVAAAANVLGQNVLGVLAMIAGIAMGRAI